MPVSKELLDIMACAFCKAELREEGDRLFCRNAECGLVYPVKDGIPIMLVDEAERPCPKCKATRVCTDDVLSCPTCSTTLRYERK